MTKYLLILYLLLALKIEEMALPYPPFLKDASERKVGHILSSGRMVLERTGSDGLGVYFSGC
jgi:hypothetical protein|uniref:Uncharacterized protein n=2 Tax=Picea TaxID=3328 RepID=A0A124GNY6_PICGL|nr:hypothetical protein ABT39_MTgene126 [Picea glauca]QHR91769.1 hypothetical protein Q903MT_gene5805 [Picea sitchensis]